MVIDNSISLKNMTQPRVCYANPGNSAIIIIISKYKNKTYGNNTDAAGAIGTNKLR